MDYVNTFPSTYIDDDDSANVILVDQFSNSISEFKENLSNLNSSVLIIFTPDPIINLTNSPESVNETVKDEVGYRDPLSIILPISICYLVIFVTGILGNVITCIVIAKNKTMHTATNYYLFNLAVSDFLVLIFGMPFDFMNIWLPNSYPFDEIVCILQGLLSETSTNATILTITSFTCERYIAICHPFRSHTMSKLSRVVKFIMAIWILAFALAMPQAFQFGTVASYGGVSCTVKTQFFEHAFEISSFLFFIVPMTVICVLYILIGIKLRQSKLLYGKKTKSCDSQRCIKGQSRVIRMLVAVVVTFFLCWAPFHAQRIMAVYGKIMKKSFSSDDLFMRVYIALTYISGISYFLSTCINPFLYNIMSKKFRNASKLTLVVHCLSRTPSTKKTQGDSNYSALSMKFGALEAGRMTTLNRNQFIIPSQPTSEILHSKDEQNIDELGNFSCRAEDVSPFMMVHPYQSIVTFTPSFEANNFSCSQFTTTSTISQDKTMKMKNPYKDRTRMNGDMTIQNDKNRRRNSFTEKLKKVLIFKPDANLMVTTNNNPKVKNVISSESISNSSLKEVDEDEFTSSELTQMMFEVNGGRHLPKLTS
ncbi:CLUMA_CG002551, isoform A [Clunio marinus]|uniref:CLUMA_CG002551, isoform A n=1 Tax=Clunio marinus TaxID=568069 RepID=A0A1J1HQR4_9DIPT|nr:CLUMA_CG002551, isoform A [Clunio marinus]